MGEFKPSRNAMMVCYLLLAVLFAVVCSVFTAAAIIMRRVPIYLILFMASLLLLIMGGIMPRLFNNHSVSISEKEIFCTRGLFNERTVFMPVDAVKSVTMVITPLGEKSGLNFVVLNAMGSKLVIPFLAKSDCVKICDHINLQIKKRQPEQ